MKIISCFHQFLTHCLSLHTWHSIKPLLPFLLTTTLAMIQPSKKKKRKRGTRTHRKSNSSIHQSQFFYFMPLMMGKHAHTCSWHTRHTYTYTASKRSGWVPRPLNNSSYPPLKHAACQRVGQRLYSARIIFIFHSFFDLCHWLYIAAPTQSSVSATRHGVS